MESEHVFSVFFSFSPSPTVALSDTTATLHRGCVAETAPLLLLHGRAPRGNPGFARRVHCRGLFSARLPLPCLCRAASRTTYPRRLRDATRHRVSSGAPRRRLPLCLGDARETRQSRRRPVPSPVPSRLRLRAIIVYCRAVPNPHPSTPYVIDRDRNKNPPRKPASSRPSPTVSFTLLASSPFPPRARAAPGQQPRGALPARRYSSRRHGPRLAGCRSRRGYPKSPTGPPLVRLGHGTCEASVPSGSSRCCAAAGRGSPRSRRGRRPAWPRCGRPGRR